jgi:hypothetical protein
MALRVRREVSAGIFRKRQCDEYNAPEMGVKRRDLEFGK